MSTGNLIRHLGGFLLLASFALALYAGYLLHPAAFWFVAAYGAYRGAGAAIETSAFYLMHAELAQKEKEIATQKKADPSPARSLMHAILISALLLPAAASAQPGPLPPRIQQIVIEQYTAHTDLARGTDDQRRTLTARIIEQIICELPNEGWGWKSAGEGRPASKDAIARQLGGRLWAWDWQNGATREPQFSDAIDITGQLFIRVECGRPPLPPNPLPIPQPLQPPLDLRPVLDELTRLHQEIAALHELFKAIEQLRAQIVDAQQVLVTQLDNHAQQPPPLYRFSIFGKSVVLRPQP